MKIEKCLFTAQLHALYVGAVGNALSHMHAWIPQNCFKNTRRKANSLNNFPGGDMPTDPPHALCYNCQTNAKYLLVPLICLTQADKLEYLY